MNKYAIIGDLHLGCNLSNLFLEYQRQSFINIKETLEERDIKEIIFLGDVFDNRKSLDVATMYFAQEIFDMFADYKITILSGNHDVLYKNTNAFSSLVFLDSYKNIDIVYKPRTKNNMVFLPWINNENKEDTLTEINNATHNDKIKYCFGHLELTGFNYNKFVKASVEEKVTLSSFSAFEKVYSGHYHTKSKMNNVVYTGTPYQLTWVDVDDEKGFYICEDDEFTFIKNDLEYFKNIVLKDNKFYDNGVEIKFNSINKYKNIKVLSEDPITDDMLTLLNRLDSEKLNVVDTTKVKLVMDDDGDNVDFQVEDMITNALSKDDDSERLLKLYGAIKND